MRKFKIVLEIDDSNIHEHKNEIRRCNLKNDLSLEIINDEDGCLEIDEDAIFWMRYGHRYEIAKVLKFEEI